MSIHIGKGTFCSACADLAKRIRGPFEAVGDLGREENKCAPVELGRLHHALKRWHCRRGQWPGSLALPPSDLEPGW
jgi:hypothetical protein